MSRRGFTLIELLTVLFVIAILIAILVPAVQAARASAWKMSCASNLKQIGTAISLYETTHGCYPVAFRYQVLPYLDQQPLYDIPRKNGAGLGTPGFLRVLDNERCPAVYRCPADSAPHGLGTIDFANYAGNGGVWVPQFGFDGIFTIAQDDHPILPGRWVKPRDVTDGLSNTALLSEMLRADGTTHRLRTGWNTPHGYADLDEFCEVCETLPPVPTDYGWHGSSQLLGNPWHSGAFPATFYNHGSPPNRPSCMNRIMVQLGLWPAKSQHAGGVNLLFADGHLEFISETIDRQVWRDYGSRVSPQGGL
jgi:prepilin-type N-terminal cleavage/methylation domain-containing protein/prepilin-type processing-associated H-X9-DG protein